MEGGRGEVGYKIVVESAIDICILSRILSSWPTCSNGWQTMHRRPIADSLAVFDVEMLEKWWLGNSAFSPQSDLPEIKNLYEQKWLWGMTNLVTYIYIYMMHPPSSHRNDKGCWF